MNAGPEPDPDRCAVQPGLTRPMGEPIITVADFTAAYGGRVVLDRVSFSVYPGQTVVLAGGSGCGKSTLLKHMIGLYRPAGGRITVAGVDVTATGTDRTRLLRSIGVAYQSGALFGSLSVLENVMLPLEEYTALTRPAMRSIAMGKLALVGLAHAASRLPSELSGGMQKRAALARAMALDPPIVFLDEPSAGLDPITSAELDALIVRLSSLLQTTFVVVTHELPSLFTIAHRVVVLDASVRTMVAYGQPLWLREACPNDWVRRFFSRNGQEGSVAAPRDV